MSEHGVVKYPKQLGAANEDLHPDWTVVKGTPKTKTWVPYVAEGREVVTGIWEATPGTLHSVSRSWEYCRIEEGKLVLTPDNGTPMVMSKGDIFVLEPTFRGTWEIIEPVRKYFVARPKV